MLVRGAEDPEGLERLSSKKSVGKIEGITREVKKILERVSRKEAAELVRKDAKERLKAVETLMSLLLELDSVKGVDAGVRELRKKVIKKAIALQEKVEAASCNGSDDLEENDEDGLNETKSSNEEMGLMEKMVKENERLVGLVKEMVRRNEKQTQILGSLAQRVEVLERALANERLRKKKKQSLGTR